MKNLLLPIAIALLAILASCGKDDGVQPGLSGSVTFAGTTTEMTDGFLVDFGADGGEYNYDFYLADGPITIENFDFSVDGNTLIYIELYNTGAAFSPGTFPVGQDGDKYLLTATIQTGGDTSFATGGSVTVTGSGQTYTIVFNLEFSDDRTLTGTVEGTYTLQGF